MRPRPRHINHISSSECRPSSETLFNYREAASFFSCHAVIYNVYGMYNTYEKGVELPPSCCMKPYKVWRR